jgi:N-acetylglucosaminyldiphosphoundecaprenol N-acetyl-beta-D-mannosaminyltransferase
VSSVFELPANQLNMTSPIPGSVKTPATHDRSVDTGGVTSRHRCVQPDRSEAALRINGVRLDPLAPDQIHDRVRSLVDCGLSHVVHFLPAHPTVIARNDPVYRDVLNRGDLNLVDGASVALAARLFGHAASRTTGSDALSLLPRTGVQSGLRHYLYGGAPQVVAKLRERLERDCPGVDVVGAESPPFRDLDDDELVQAATRIREAGTDLLWIGIGTPRQDLVADRLRELEAAPVILCVGAAFDFVAGTKKRAPRWMRSIGMEWLFRLASEPTRLWRRYLIGNAQFLAGVLHDFIKARRPGRGDSSPMA